MLVLGRRWKKQGPLIYAAGMRMLEIHSRRKTALAKIYQNSTKVGNSSVGLVAVVTAAFPQGKQHEFIMAKSQMEQFLYTHTNTMVQVTCSQLTRTF